MSVMATPDPVWQMLQRKAYRVRRAHPNDKREQGSALLKTFVRLLDSKVGRNEFCRGGVASGERDDAG